MARRVGAALSALVLAAFPIAAAPATASAAPVAPCTVTPGGPFPTVPWPQRRLDFQQAWATTTGVGVRVAVVDSGLDRTQPQVRRIAVDGGRSVIEGFDPANTADCDGHGTAVTAIIAAPKVADTPFVGVAPGVTIIPVKQTNTRSDNTSTVAGIAAGIDTAIAAGARVVNVSVTYSQPSPVLRQAVARAQRARLIIVAAAGNDGQGNNRPAYPAAYSTEFDNVIAVSATDQADQVSPFSESGNYVTVAAPGVGVIAPTPIRGYGKVDGTSFAAPFVTGTAALVLAAHPELTPAQVRTRIEATADRPPASVPDRRYGWGVVNPYLAVTSVRDDPLPAAAAPRTPAPLPPRAVPPAPDRHLQHVALGSSLALLGVAALAVAGVAVLRRGPVLTR